MNEERLNEESPPLSPGEQRGELDRRRQDRQLEGARALGNPPPQPSRIPVGIAPPDPMNVLSTFDTRPIGAYDFANTQVVLMGNGEVVSNQSVTYDVPDGYTAALRRVRVEFSPPGAVSTTVVVTGTDPALLPHFNISLMRDGVIIPNNTVRFFGPLTSYEWPTHQVYGFYESIGLFLALGAGFAIPSSTNESLIVAVTFMGTLIPTKSKPPATEIASAPVLVRDYDKFVKQPPDVGAAGV